MKQLLLSMLVALVTTAKTPEVKHKRILTPVEEIELISIIKESYANVHKQAPEDEIIAGALAHISLENNHGKNVWNYNFGNIGKLPEEPPAPYYSHFGKAKYRSFKTSIEGGEAYWRFVSRCKMAIHFFKKKDPQNASISLKRCNYYRSDQEQYSKTLSVLYARGIKRVKLHRDSR